MEKRDKKMPYEVVIQERKRVDLYGNVVYYIYWFDKYGYNITKEWKFWSKGPKKKCDFKPFDQVLVRASNLGNWNLHLFARVREEEYKYECLGGLRYKECIPYQGNEHLLGTNKSK